ncbi:hypothetical protein [Clostridium sp.]|nr:hypothetical protein [Clostridium sp.]
MRPQHVEVNEVEEPILREGYGKLNCSKVFDLIADPESSTVKVIVDCQ